MELGERKELNIPHADLSAGLCRSEDVAHLFSSGNTGDIIRAKKICAECPVAEPCLDRAVAVLPKFGVWAGLTTRAIATEARQRRKTARLIANAEPVAA